MSWVKIIYIVQTNWSWKQSSTLWLCIVLKWVKTCIPIQSHPQLPQSQGILNRINKPGRLKPIRPVELCSKVSRALDTTGYSKRKSDRAILSVLCDLFDYFKWRTKEECTWAAAVLGAHLRLWWSPVETEIKPGRAWECNISHVVSSSSNIKWTLSLGLEGQGPTTPSSDAWISGTDCNAVVSSLTTSILQYTCS